MYATLRGCARLACVLASLFLLIVMTSPPAHANPAAQVTRTVVQPDGATLELRLWGDEFANGWETLQGHTVFFDRAIGGWTFAVRDPYGALTSSGIRADQGPPPAELHLRPTEEAALRDWAPRTGEVTRNPQLDAAPGWATGNTNVLVILVQFPADPGDPNGAQPAVPATFTAAQIQANLFGAAATGPGNMTDYYDQVSFGNLHLVGTVVGPYTVTHDKNDYDDGPSNAAALVQQAIQLADADVDFAPFDNDGNGQVDFVAIAYAGNGPDNGLYEGADPNVNDIWPHAWHIGAVNVDGGARSVTEYFIAPELSNVGVRRTIGVYAHELGHKLGLPDLYDADGGSQGVGHWCLMGSGSWCSDTPGIENGESPSHMSAWCKYFMGWITPTDQTNQQVGLNVPRADSNPYAIRLLANPGGADDWPGSGEYFLIENRQRNGFDVGLDGCGILVWHIDEAMSHNKTPGHTSGSHRLVDLEEADGSPQDLDTAGPNRGDANDPFPGATNNRQWDGASNPHSDLYDGSDSNQRMRVISAAACEATMQISLNNLPPVANAGPDQLNVECTGPTGALVNLNGTGSSDPDGDPLTYTWTAPGIVFNNLNSATPNATFPEGSTVVTLTVSDGIESDTDQMTVRVVDTTPPTIVCPASITVECTEHGGTPATDPAIDAFLTGATATDACNPNPVITHDGPAFFPHGTTTVTFTATDDATNSASCTADVTVVDTTPPTISVTLSRDALWPPNHKLADITASLVVEDICDPTPTFVLTSITSDEPDNGLGDGDTPNDIQGASFNTADLTFKLRSERAGVGDGRVYTIIYTASDDDGNTATDTAWVRCPHNRSGEAVAAGGFAGDGLSLNTGVDRFTVVIPTNVDQNALRIEAARAQLGNTSFVLSPSAWWLADVTGDGRQDLVLEYSGAGLKFASGTSEEIEGGEVVAPVRDREGYTADVPAGEPEPVGLHYLVAGEDWLVADVFALGTPIAVGDGPIRDLETRAPATTATLTPAPETPAAPLVSAYDGRTLTLAAPGRVRYEVFNVLGRRVRTVVDAEFGIGARGLAWDGTDQSGRPAPNGIYFHRLTGPGIRSVRKTTLLR